MVEDFGKPYPGIPPGKKTTQMESCVKQVMTDPKMKSKYPDEKERKSHAIAVCHVSIMGKGEETENENLSDMSKRNALAKLNQTDIPASAKAKAFAKLVATAKQVGIEVSEKTDYSELEKLLMEGGEQTVVNEKNIKDKIVEPVLEKAADTGNTVVEENKEEAVKDSGIIDKKATEEKVEEVGGTMEKENKNESVKEEKPAEEVKTEVKEEAKEEVVAEDLEKKDKPGDACTLDGKIGKLVADKDGKLVCTVVEEKKVDIAETIKASFDGLSIKLDELINLVKKAPAEGASDKETPKREVAVEAKKEEVAKVEATVEEKPAEELKVEETKVEKVEAKDTSSEEASKELLEKIDSLTKRIEEIEKQPAPSKVVVSKSFVGDEEGKTLDLAKIDSRLAEIAKIRDGNPQGYTEKLRDEALDLIKQKKALQVF